MEKINSFELPEHDCCTLYGAYDAFVKQSFD